MGVIAGFVVALTFTTRGGGTIDIACHATVLPLLLIMLAVVALPHAWARSPQPSA